MKMKAILLCYYARREEGSTITEDDPVSFILACCCCVFLVREPKTRQLSHLLAATSFHLIERAKNSSSLNSRVKLLLF